MGFPNVTMKPNFHVIAVATAFIFCGSARAQEEAEIDPFSAETPVSEQPSNPDHLEPIPPYEFDGYSQAVFQSLVENNESVEAWMIVMPSFSPEYAVILRHLMKFSEPDDPFDRKLESERWVVESVEARKQIWRWKEIEGGGMKLDIKVTKELNRKRAEVTGEFAAAILSAWESVLRETRYPEMDHHGLDGTTYQFYRDHGLFGEIWSPTTGPPRVLAELGHELGEVAQAAEGNRGKHMEKCLKLAQELRASPAKSE